MLARKSKSYHHGDLSRALVQAGLELLREDGLDGLSLRTVAQRVGVSRSAPYAHFADKRALLRAISASGFRDLANAMEALNIGDQRPRDLIISYGEAYVQFALDNPNLYRLMISSLEPKPDAAVSDDTRGDLVIEATRPFALLSEEFSRMVKDAARAEILSQGAWSAVHGLASLMGEKLFTPPEGGAGEILRTLMETQTRSPSSK